MAKAVRQHAETKYGLLRKYIEKPKGGRPEKTPLKNKGVSQTVKQQRYNQDHRAGLFADAPAQQRDAAIDRGATDKALMDMGRAERAKQANSLRRSGCFLRARGGEGQSEPTAWTLC
jgi:hypothetical protein